MPQMAESQVLVIPFVERMPRPLMVENNRSMSWITDLLTGIPLRKRPSGGGLRLVLPVSSLHLVFSVFYTWFSPASVSGETISR